MLQQTIYYLPGRGGLMTQGLGAELTRRELSVIGRETVGAFRDLTFQEQIDVIADDLKNQFWFPQAQVLAMSFGPIFSFMRRRNCRPILGQCSCYRRSSVSFPTTPLAPATFRRGQKN